MTKLMGTFPCVWGRSVFGINAALLTLSPNGKKKTSTTTTNYFSRQPPMAMFANFINTAVDTLLSSTATIVPGADQTAQQEKDVIPPPPSTVAIDLSASQASLSPSQTQFREQFSALNSHHSVAGSQVSKKHPPKKVRNTQPSIQSTTPL